jgi:hypothetical protein
LKIYNIGLKSKIRDITKTFNSVRTRLYYYILVGNVFSDPDKNYFIDPHKITGQLKMHQFKYLVKKTGRRYNVVIGGNWDKEVTYLDFKNDHIVYKSCIMRWIQGLRWEETPVVKEYIRRLKSGIPCRFESYETLMERYNELDAIYNKVLIDGAFSDRKEDLIRINVTRDGNLIWGPDGRHRIAVALIAGLNRIPVRIGFVHSKGVKFLKLLK